MSIENSGQPSKFEQTDSELFDEDLALDRLQGFVEKILDLVVNNPQYNVDTKWFNLVYGLGATMGVENVDTVLEQKGWNKNEFPREILSALPEKPTVIYLLTREQFKELPEGTRLVDISGEEVVVGDKDLEKEKIKNGYLPFGFAEGSQPTDLKLKPYKIDYEQVAMIKKLGL